jgi:ribosomal protein S6
MEMFFETIAILKPDFTPDEINLFIQEYHKYLNQFSHRDTHIEDIGVKKLAYKVRDCLSGYYVLFTWCLGVSHCSGKDAKLTRDLTLQNLEQKLQKDDRVIKFVTVSMDKDDPRADLKLQDESLKVEQSSPKIKIDALDVLLGKASYKNISKNISKNRKEGN